MWALRQNVISSNTLFHFTDKLEHLISILEDDFRPGLSWEELPIRDSNREGEDATAARFQWCASATCTVTTGLA